MTPEEVKSHLTVQPFKPFRIHMTNSRSVDITHPDQVMVTRAKVWVGVGRDPVRGIMDHVEHCSLLHIVGIEALRAA